MRASKLAPGLDVSCETRDRLNAFVQHLKRWTAAINLIRNVDEDTIWMRHVVDSAQLLLHVPNDARTWIDLGSGGGLPGLVCAIVVQERPQCPTFTLVEADTRKAIFLRETARALDLPVRVWTARAETCPAQPFDVISARALAPLLRLLPIASRFCHAGTTCLFPKGKTARQELTEARRAWHIDTECLPSVTDSDGVILKITSIEARS